MSPVRISHPCVYPGVPPCTYHHRVYLPSVCMSHHVYVPACVCLFMCISPGCLCVPSMCMSPACVCPTMRERPSVYMSPPYVYPPPCVYPTVCMSHRVCVYCSPRQVGLSVCLSSSATISIATVVISRLIEKMTPASRPLRDSLLEEVLSFSRNQICRCICENLKSSCVECIHTEKT